MMVDLDDDPEWSVSDELDDEDSERYSLNFFLILSCWNTCPVLNKVKFMLLRWRMKNVINNKMLLDVLRQWASAVRMLRFVVLAFFRFFISEVSDIYMYFARSLLWLHGHAISMFSTWSTLQYESCFVYVYLKRTSFFKILYNFVICHTLKLLEVP